MIRSRRLPCLVGLLFFLVELDAQNWPRFRGPAGAGVLDGRALPHHWEVDSGKNIVWKQPIRGTGHSSPVIWGDHLFLTTAVGAKDVELKLGDTGGIDLAEDEILEWSVHCIDKKTGATLWKRTPYRGCARAKRHVKSSQANATPVTDGNFVVAILGSQGMVAFDTKGERLWSKDLGRLDPGLWKDPTSQWGHSSSPVIHRDKVIVQVDRHADSFLAAYRLTDGEEVWRLDRDELPVWSSPLIAEFGGRTELIVNGGNSIRSYDPDTGEESWHFRDFAEVKTPTPFLAEGRLIVTGGYPGGRPIFAFRPGLQGDVSLKEGEKVNRALFFNTQRYSGYTPTPLVYRSRLYSLADNGVLTVLQAQTGTLERRMRLGGLYSASPVAGDGKLFFCSEDGEVVVLEASTLNELSRMQHNAPCMATPAISEGRIFIRTQRTLYAIGTSATREGPE